MSTADRFYQDHPELVQLATLTERQEFRRQLYLLFLANQRAVDAMADEFRDRLADRRTAVQRWSWVSPVLLVQEALTALSGTGLDRYLSFQDQVREFVAAHRDFFAPRIVQWQPVSAADVEAMPNFTFDEPPSVRWRQALLLCAGCLAVWSVCLIVVTGRRTHRTE
jgi:hypothetical protein